MRHAETHAVERLPLRQAGCIQAEADTGARAAESDAQQVRARGMGRLAVSHECTPHSTTAILSSIGGAGCLKCPATTSVIDCRWRALLEDLDEGTRTAGGRSTAGSVDPAVEAARLQAEAAFSKPTYSYRPVDSEQQEAVSAAGVGRGAGLAAAGDSHVRKFAVARRPARPRALHQAASRPSGVHTGRSASLLQMLAAYVH